MPIFDFTGKYVENYIVTGTMENTIVLRVKYALSA